LIAVETIPPGRSLLLNTSKRRLTMSDFFRAAIDPMALVLSGKAYLIWVEMKHPHVQKVGEIREFLGTLSREDRERAAQNAAALATFSRNVQEALGERA
jgi:hypothetical protein